jgi:hypothetical protein
MRSNTSGFGSRALQQVAAHQRLVAVFMADRHPAFVGQTHQHLAPGQGLLRKRREKGDRATPAGDHQGRLAVAVDGVTQRTGDVLGQRLSQLRRIAVAAGDHAHGKIEVRDRHTRPSHHE